MGRSLRTKTLLGIAVAFLSVMAVVLSGVAFVYAKHNRQVATTLIRNSFQVTDYLLEENRTKLAADLHHMVTRNALGGSLKYLAEIGPLLGDEAVRTTYRGLTDTLHRTAAAAQFQRAMIYDREGNLVAFYDHWGDTSVLGWFRPRKTIEVATVVAGENVSAESWVRGTELPPGIEEHVTKPVPATQTATLDDVHGALNLVVRSPILARAYDPESDSLQPEPFGLAVALQRLDKTFTDRVSRLSSTEVRIARMTATTAAEVRRVCRIDHGQKRADGVAADQYYCAHTLEMAANATHRGIWPVVLNDDQITAFESFPSHEFARSQHLEAIGVVVVLFLVGLLILIPILVLAVSRWIINPISRVTAVMGDIAAGERFEERVPIVSADEIGQLASSFNRMSSNLQRTTVSKRELEVAHTKIAQQLREIQDTRETLIQSTRLASVGEMAGRVAHEVLNPITSIHARISRTLQEQNGTYAENLGVFADIITGWRDEYERGGFTALIDSLNQPVGDGRTLLEDDLAGLEALHEYLATRGSTVADSCRLVLREADRVTHIVDGMRGLTRSNVTPEVAALDKLLQDTGDGLTDGLHKRNITLSIDCAAEHQVHLDKYELMQVLSNLLRNAMLAIEEKRGRNGGSIGIDVAQREEWLEIRVRDSGVGIPPENIPFVFESSFTTRSASDGTGLGLSISQRLARGFGGELTIECSEVGVGTTALLTLPRYLQESATTEPISARAGPDPPAAGEDHVAG
jgi:signal transduction histidine kinase